ncbi:MAG: hypothetical protein A2142_02265 [candidate division Zixibacteria bacterium RBG_16_48_11]|nr:MAG: hypothetical protein A2142_02265 [candidate division Zixibacteria bacterium RBG_16_48_11]
MNYYLLILVFFYFLFRLAGIFKESKSWGKVIKLLGYFAVFLVVGFLLSAVLYLPFYKYIPYSPRGGEEGRGYEFATSWPMNPEETMNMAVPDFSGTSVGNGTYWGRNFFKLHSEYLGAVAVFLAVLGIILGRRDNLIIFFVVMTVLAFTVAWGGNTPLYKLYYNLVPGFKKFRAPSLIYFLIAFNLVVLSAFGLQSVLVRLKSGQNAKNLIKFTLIICGVVIGGAILVSLASSGLKSMLAGLVKDQPAKLSALEANFPKFIAGMWKFALLTMLVTGVLFALIKQRIKLVVAGVILGLVTVIDLWMVESKYIQTVSLDKYSQSDEVVRELQKDKTRFRFFPVPDPRGRGYRNDDYHMIFELQSIAGEHGNQLQRYNEFLGAGQNVMVDYHNLFSNLNFLNLVNAKYIITPGPIGAPFFREVHRGNLFIYENVNALPRVFAVSSYEVINDPAKILERIASPDFNPRQTVVLEKEPTLRPETDSLQTNVSISEYNPAEVKLTADLGRPALIVLLDNYYPDWQVRVDGHAAEIYRANYTFRAVSVPSGRHQITFSFEPQYYYMGKKISLFSMAGILAFLIGDWSFRKLKSRRTAPSQ